MALRNPNPLNLDFVSCSGGTVSITARQQSADNTQKVVGVVTPTAQSFDNRKVMRPYYDQETPSDSNLVMSLLSPTL